MNWFLYDNGLRRKRVKWGISRNRQTEEDSGFGFMQKLFEHWAYEQNIWALTYCNLLICTQTCAFQGGGEGHCMLRLKNFVLNNFWMSPLKNTMIHEKQDCVISFETKVDV